MRLDDLYKMTAAIYRDANLSRSRESTFLHFVEVAAMLTVAERHKIKEKIDIPGALCKALGWYFPLLAKMGVASVEELIFAKYPLVCPYCRLTTHDESVCKRVKGVENVVDHDAVNLLNTQNRKSMPSDLNGWQNMFKSIYPRNLGSKSFSIIALFEELGELAEAVRVFDRYPHYFYGEVADAFSYIMGMANEYALTDDFDFQREYLSRYPGLCVNCGSRTCICPPVPAATVGRMAKELKVDVSAMRIADLDQFTAEGLTVAAAVFEELGDDPAIGKHFPVDRGELNSSLVQLAFRLAAAVQEVDEGIAKELRRDALQLGAHRSEIGSRERTGLPVDLVSKLRTAWIKLGDEAQNEIRESSSDGLSVTALLEDRLLVVTSNPQAKGDQALRLDREVREIRESFRRSKGMKDVRVDHLTASTIDDFRRELMENQFSVIHFSGHAGIDGLSFMKGDDDTELLEYVALTPLVANQKHLQAIILNACSSGLNLPDNLGVPVVGMMDEIDDEDAVAFAKGFYDSYAAGQTPREAFDQGVLSVKSKSGDSDLFVWLGDSQSA